MLIQTPELRALTFKVLPWNPVIFSFFYMLESNHAKVSFTVCLCCWYPTVLLLKCVLHIEVLLGVVELTAALLKLCFCLLSVVEFITVLQ